MSSCESREDIDIVQIHVSQQTVVLSASEEVNLVSLSVSSDAGTDISIVHITFEGSFTFNSICFMFLLIWMGSILISTVCNPVYSLLFLPVLTSWMNLMFYCMLILLFLLKNYWTNLLPLLPLICWWKASFRLLLYEQENRTFSSAAVQRKILSTSQMHWMLDIVICGFFMMLYIEITKIVFLLKLFY